MNSDSTLATAPRDQVGLTEDPTKVQAAMPVITAPATNVASRRLSLLTTIIVALLGAATSLPAVMSLDGAFPVENLSVEMTNRIRARRDDPIAWAKERSNRWTSLYKTTASCLGVFGAATGAFFGLLLAFPHSSPTTMLRTTLSGSLLGGTFAAAGGVLEAALLMNLETLGLDPSLKTIIGHAVGWSGMAAGLSLLLTSVRTDSIGYLQRLISGAVGGALAALIYSPLSAVLFQLERSDMSIPEGTLNRLMFLTIAALFVLIAVQRPIPIPNKGSESETSDSSLPSPTTVSTPTI
ncbi:hypothetical protein [Schlesneria sp. T3-172]|uniref:hypothetical protein n=1 Tax=Schlesneria sphaerica TaxID=3373610 RepID=UPI0037C66741